MKNQALTWPQDYLNWTGGFDDLVTTASEILKQVAPGMKAPTASIVRYYQQQNLVGRGVRQGKTSQFSFEDLSQLVTTKQMLDQQVSLTMTKNVFENVPATYISQMDPSMGAYASSPAAATTMLLNNSSSFESNGKNTKASQLVSGLLSQAYAQEAPVYQSGSVSTSGLGGAIGRNPFPPVILPDRHVLLPGLVVEIYPQLSTPQAQANALRDLADQINPHFYKE